MQTVMKISGMGVWSKLKGAFSAVGAGQGCPGY